MPVVVDIGDITVIDSISDNLNEVARFGNFLTGVRAMFVREAWNLAQLLVCIPSINISPWKVKVNNPGALHLFNGTLHLILRGNSIMCTDRVKWRIMITKVNNKLFLDHTGEYREVRILTDTLGDCLRHYQMFMITSTVISTAHSTPTAHTIPLEIDEDDSEYIAAYQRLCNVINLFAGEIRVHNGIPYRVIEFIELVMIMLL